MTPSDFVDFCFVGILSMQLHPRNVDLSTPEGVQRAAHLIKVSYDLAIIAGNMRNGVFFSENS